MEEKIAKLRIWIVSKQQADSLYVVKLAIERVAIAI